MRKKRKAFFLFVLLEYIKPLLVKNWYNLSKIMINIQSVQLLSSQTIVLSFNIKKNPLLIQ